mmetsp:Transcript_29483/g.77571  ORF Transcript_29483/g.77571 Transcript_29483/m.77571 type:complete len:121 (+) Transcript_29483:253-615(+)|eukprot:CAMPEP_0113706910 /NCGR_PEP_ID=MMETSP0038_2-20120614/28046_1 /TAXON_ID=2898 /ORGANISM="Cryptomonas paramecium" /LENGTH=120 /DNA_ID=CAMNT_0000632273 /DNA_START=121 /DNA_END=483 /DNA_ORIENTATION=+ /assembly_acc=CAM_ASM_000170
MSEVHRSRCVLTSDQVLEIYGMLEFVKQVSAGKVAKKYGVSEKAVRNIWNGRAWGKLTSAKKDSSKGLRCADDGTRGKLPSVLDQVNAIEQLCESDETRQMSIDDLLFVWSGFDRNPKTS